jgi:hypothetical protein
MSSKLKKSNFPVKKILMSLKTRWYCMKKPIYKLNGSSGPFKIITEKECFLFRRTIIFKLIFNELNVKIYQQIKYS